MQRDFQIDRGVIRHPVPARPAPMIVFEFGDPVTILIVDQGIRVPSPVAVPTVVGLQTCRRVEMELQGKISTLAIMFQPDGLQRLFSLPSQELPNRGGDAHAVLGSCMSQLRQTLGGLSSFDERARVLNDFFFKALPSTATHSISEVVRYIVRQRGCVDIAALSDGAGLSPRHFARRFIDYMGMRPKLFARIVRFQAALESKALHSGKTWTEVAHDFGYFDQMHLIHDFALLAGGSPKEMLTHLETVFVEEIRRIRSNAVEAVAASDRRLTL
ncbi:MAG: helix-turn-helix domain-containing protein [Acidobacteriota bacterium]|nr:helix-turn-helix domain-containing protein [Acidobacteriota bacterium]